MWMLPVCQIYCDQGTDHQLKILLCAGEDGAKQSFPANSLVFQHAILNLPASAVDFLDVFNGLYDESTWTGPMPLIHCYTFSKGAETHEGTPHQWQSSVDLFVEASSPYTYCSVLSSV